MRAERLPLLFILTCAAGAFAACHDHSGQSDAGVSSCSGRLTGAISETIVGCKITWSEKAGVADIGNDGNIDVSDPSSIVDFSHFGFVFTVNGDAHTGTFSTANVSSFAAGVDVRTDAGSNGYIANFSSNPTGPPKVGSLSTEISGVVFDFKNGATTQWIVHGSLNADLEPAPMSGSKGSVQMTLDF